MVALANGAGFEPALLQPVASIWLSQWTRSSKKQGNSGQGNRRKLPGCLATIRNKPMYSPSFRLPAFPTILDARNLLLPNPGRPFGEHNRLQPASLIAGLCWDLHPQRPASPPCYAGVCFQKRGCLVAQVFSFVYH